jgi:uncharacterized protein (UPF0335 family)
MDTKKTSGLVGQKVTVAPPEISIGAALGEMGNTRSVNPLHQPTIRKSPPNIGATGQILSIHGHGKKTPVSEESRLIVSGMVEAFMHRQHLLPGEKTCLEDSVSELTGDVVGTGKDVVDAVKTITNITNTSSMNGTITPAGVTSRVSPTHSKFKSEGSVMSAGIDAAVKLTSLVTLATTLVKNCVQGDALRMLNETAHHLIDMKYLGHRLLVSGVDIAHYLADSIISYEEHRYHSFGKDIGTTLRKVLLSNSSTGSRLPEGVPEEQIIQETTEGLMDGFFVGGSTMEITDSARPDVDINLNLHRCVAGNQPFFKEIFLSLWNAMAQFSLNGEKHDLDTSTDGETPKWSGELMIVLMQLPQALERCNVDAETEGMLLEAIQTFGHVHMHLDFPKMNATAIQISRGMATAVKDWTNWRFKGFGKEIGIMLREAVLMLYPKKYSVGHNGRLQRHKSLAPSFLPLLFVVVALTALAGFAALRRKRSSGHIPTIEEANAQLVDGHLLDLEAIE